MSRLSHWDRRARKAATAKLRQPAKAKWPLFLLRERLTGTGSISCLRKNIYSNTRASGIYSSYNFIQRRSNAVPATKANVGRDAPSVGLDKKKKKKKLNVDHRAYIAI